MGVWYQFSHLDVKNTGIIDARGCDPADPQGLTCVAQPGTQFAPAPAWTFAGAAALTVTDAFTYGESFYVLDNGNVIGGTPIKMFMNGQGCGGNPNNCVNDNKSSHAVFNLGGGNHAITIQAKDTPDGEGSAFFRIDAAGAVTAPEPSAFLSVLGGLAVLVVKWRRRLS
jgi:hypothetical protein